MQDVVQDYYGKQLQSTADLKTSACCDVSNMPNWLKPLLANIHDDVLSRYYGCGLVCPALLEGCRILDLGSGSGRDVYALAQLVGSSGHVVGIDMTDEQLAIAKEHQDYHSDKFGYENVTFIKGYLETLDELDLEDNSFDIIVSNCVINLSTDKAAVMASVQRLLKPGGEFYFSDVYSDRRIPQHLVEDPVLYGECLSGALYWKDFERLSRDAKFLDPRLVEDRPLEITDPLLAAKIGEIKFFSATYRLFKSESIEDACEDYGQAVIYKGSIDQLPHRFDLDKHHSIETGRVFSVCANTYQMLKESRFAPHFEFIGDNSQHYGIFAGCGDSIPFGQSQGNQLVEVAPMVATTNTSSSSGGCC
ncbi:methyltransferase domain-containing protein [Psychrobacter sp. DM4]|uniref:methyltransferase domain-containing protein n=1 Tax=Psychrobacter sp. DM4 TaxID=3440637 RepID=UPI003F50C84B